MSKQNETFIQDATTFDVRFHGWGYSYDEALARAAIISAGDSGKKMIVVYYVVDTDNNRSESVKYMEISASGDLVTDLLTGAVNAHRD